jgi:hypothetical protein
MGIAVLRENTTWSARYQYCLQRSLCFQTNPKGLATFLASSFLY